MIVMKFGGTSVGSAEAIRRVTRIVAERKDQKPVVVVSAMAKTTDRLLEMARHAAAGQRAKALELLLELEQFHLREGGSVNGRVEQLFQELGEVLRGLAALGELTPRSLDAVASYGERLSSLIVSENFRQAGLDAVHLDSREVIITDERFTEAAPIFEETYRRLAERIPPLTEQGKIVVMGGFIGSSPRGITTTLGRGGSDFTAAIVGAGIGAREVQIWTDVDGLMTTDPRLVPTAYRIKRISFEEAAELAYFGARVLHPATLIPAMEKNIPVRILNSYRPEIPGTWVVAERVPCKNVVKAIALKRGVTVINVSCPRMVGAWGFLHRIFEVFAKHQTSVDMVTTSEVSVSATIDNTRALEAISNDLSQFAQVEVESNQAIVCLVGDNIRYTPGIAARVFSALRNINVRMISQGASLLNLGFVVADSDATAAVQALHQEFFSEIDPEVFE